MAIINPNDNYSKVVKLISDYATENETLRKKVEQSIAGAQTSIGELLYMNTKYSAQIAAIPPGSEKETDFNNLDQERVEMVIGFTALLDRLDADPTQEELAAAQTKLGL